MTGELASAFAAPGAVALAVLVLAVAHGFSRHGWGPRLAARLRRRAAPLPTPHHERHLARTRRARGLITGRLHEHHD